MEKQGFIEKLVYYIVGGVFFVGYYFLMMDVFHVNPFKGIAIVLSLYFVFAIIAFPKAGDLLSGKVEKMVVDSKLVMPIAYLIAPVLFFFEQEKK